MSDLSITATSVVPSTSAVKFLAKLGATCNGGQTVYLDTSTNTYKLADGNDATKMPVAGILCGSGGSGQTVQAVSSDPNLTIGTHGLGLGIPMFQSATAGGICPAADLSTGNLTTCLMVTNTTTTVSFGIIGGVGAHA
jgi:hypothetical protein